MTTDLLSYKLSRMDNEALFSEAVRIGKLMESKTLLPSEKAWAKKVFAATYDRAETPELKYTARIAWWALRFI